jgi:hypothetical protein
LKRIDKDNNINKLLGFCKKEGILEEFKETMYRWHGVLSKRSLKKHIKEVSTFRQYSDPESFFQRTKMFCEWCSDGKRELWKRTSVRWRLFCLVNNICNDPIQNIDVIKQYDYFGLSEAEKKFIQNYL